MADVRIFLFLIIVLSGLLIGEAVGQCTEERLMQCLSDSGYNDGVRQRIAAYCRDTQPDFDDCMQGILDLCNSSDAHQSVRTYAITFKRQFVYICSEDALPKFIRSEQCYLDPDLQSKLKVCNDAYGEAAQAPDGATRICHVISILRACRANEIYPSCGEETVEIYDEVESLSLEAAVERQFPHCDVRDSLDKYCYPNPCRNGGSCESPVGEPMCTCKYGYTGSHCETVGGDPSECSIQTVQNCLGNAGFTSPDVYDNVFPYDTDAKTFCWRRSSAMVECLDDILQACSTSPSGKAVKATAQPLKYIFVRSCSKKNITELTNQVNCLRRDDSRQKIKECDQEFNDNSVGVRETSELCRLTQRQRACTAIEIAELCGAGAATFYDEIRTYGLNTTIQQNLGKCGFQSLLVSALKQYCYPNPCENGGSCESLAGNLTCLCHPGYTGPQCENMAGGTVPVKSGVVLGILAVFLLDVFYL